MENRTTSFEAKPRNWMGILGVTIALSAPVVQALMGPWLENTFEFPIDRFVSLWNFWIAVVVVLALAKYGEGYSLARFGFKPNTKSLRERLIDWIITALSALVIGAVLVFFNTYVRGLLTEVKPISPADLTLFPYWVLIPAWITGAFTEEVLFRSYSIERLTDLTGNRWLANLVTVVTFGVFHVFGWDWVHVLTITLPGGIMMTLFYHWRRSLVLCVFIHAILNAPLLLLPLLAPFM